jgi:hypothetical protein
MMESQQEYTREEFVHGPVIFVIVVGLLVMYIFRSTVAMGHVLIIGGPLTILQLVIILATPLKMIIDKDQKTFVIYSTFKPKVAVYSLDYLTCTYEVRPTRTGPKKVFKFRYKRKIILNMEYANAGWSDDKLMVIHDQLCELTEKTDRK